MVDPSKHADHRNWTETILRYIPGFRGYLEKEYRRESDQLLRTWMVDELQKAKVAVDEAMQAMLAQGDLDSLPACERVHGRIDQLQNALRGAVQGYSGWFDFVAVDEKRLDAVYAQDSATMKSVEAFVAQAKAFGASPDSAQATELLTSAGALIDSVKERSRILEGLGA